MYKKLAKQQARKAGDKIREANGKIYLIKKNGGTLAFNDYKNLVFDYYFEP